jgi:hypothetical protein
MVIPLRVSARLKHGNPGRMCFPTTLRELIK